MHARAIPIVVMALVTTLLLPASAQIEVVMASSSEGGGISVSNDPQIAKGGKIMFKGEREVGDDDVDGVYIGYAGGGGVSPLVEVGSPAEFQEIEGAAMSSNGKVIFVATVLINVEQTGGIKPVRERQFFSGSDPYEEYEDGTKPLGRLDGPFAINDNLWTVGVVNGVLVMGITGQLVVGNWASAGPFYFPKAINNNNQIAFVHRLPDEMLKTVKRAEFEPDGGGGHRLVVTPLASGFEGVDSLSLDDSGRAVFVGWLPGEMSSALYEATGAAQVLAREGDGKGFSNFGTVSVSPGGQIAFSASYESPSGDQRYGIFRGFNGTADKIVAEGDRVTYDGAEWEISIGGFGTRGVNDSGQIVFSGSMQRDNPLWDGSSEDTPRRFRLRGIFVTSGVGDPPDDDPPDDDPEDDPPSTFTWVNNAGGAFATTSNWEPAQVPVKNGERADTALFNLGGAYTVDTPDAATERLLVRGGEVTLNVGAYTVASTSIDSPSVSITRSGLLNITGGTLQSVNTVIGNGAIEAGQVAEAHLFNSGVTWDNPGRMTIGGFSRGRLFVANGPTLTTGEAHIGVAASGEAVIGGMDTLWDTGSLAVGYSAEGSLIVESGGHARVERLHIGRAEGLGTVTVDGASSRLTVTESALNFTVGEGNGEGALVVRNGGRVEATGDAMLSVGFAEAATGSVLVEGFDAATNARSTLHLDPSTFGYLLVGSGAGGTGVVWIEDGALVESAIASLGLEQGSGDVFVRGSGNALPSRWENTGDLTAGERGAGSVQIEAGGLVATKHLTIGKGEGGNGVVTVSGVGADGLPSLLRVSESAGNAVVGRDGGQGELRIEGGGRVDLDPLGVLQIGIGGGEGAVTVRGFDPGTGKRSTLELERSVDLAGLLIVTDGTLEVEDGGVVRSRHGWIGFFGETAHAVVSGAGNGSPSFWEILSQLDVGVDHQGSLHITAGGEVSTAGFKAGSGANGQAAIRVRGVDAGGVPSTLRVTDSRLNFDLGQNGGRATLHIEDGGRVVAPGESWMSFGAGELLVRGFDSETGTRSHLEVDGEGFGWLVIGSGGAALRVEDGARVDCQIGTLGLGGNELATAFVGGAGAGQPAHWRVGEQLEIGQAPGVGAPGTLTIAADGAVTVGEAAPVAGSLVIGNGGTLSGHGTILAPGGAGAGGGVNNFAGTVAPGASPGTLTIDGDYTQGAAGVLEIEIGGPVTGANHDQLVVTGTATFEEGARIRLILIDPDPGDGVEEVFLPHAGAVFQILAASEITLPPGATLNDLVEAGGLPSNIAMDLRLEIVDGGVAITSTSERQPYAGPLPAFASTVWSLDGPGIELAITEPVAGFVYALQASTDLTAWTTVMSRKSAGTTHLFTDGSPARRPASFYRLVVP